VRDGYELGVVDERGLRTGVASCVDDAGSSARSEEVIGTARPVHTRDGDEDEYIAGVIDYAAPVPEGVVYAYQELVNRV
jgi:hypothetical protein